MARGGQWDCQLLEKPSGAGAAQERVAVPGVRKAGGAEGKGDFSPPSEMNGMDVSMCVYSLRSDEAANYS